MDETLEHFGVKGMRWGVRRNSSSSGDSHANLKRNVKIAGGVAAGVAGAAAAAYLLNKHGSLPTHSVAKLSASHQGKQAVEAFNEQLWRKQTSNIMWATQAQAAHRLRAPR